MPCCYILPYRLQSYNPHQVKYVILINCGATIDLTEPGALIAEDQIVFVADNHRPINLANFYSDSNIHMLCRLDSEELNEIPPHEEIFRDDVSSLFSYFNHFSPFVSVTSLNLKIFEALGIYLKFSFSASPREKNQKKKTKKMKGEESGNGTTTNSWRKETRNVAGMRIEGGCSSIITNLVFTDHL